MIDGDEECDGAALVGDCTDFGFSKPDGLACDNCALDPSGCTTTCDGALEPGEPCDDGNDNPNDGCDDCVLVNTTGTCAMPNAVALSAGTTVLSGTTVGGGQQTTDQCNGEVMASDVVYAVTPATDGFLTAYLTDTDTDYDSMLYALADCNATASGLGCADNFPNGKEIISFHVVANTTYFVVVDGWNGSVGNYALNLDLSVGDCTDPVPFPLWPGVPMNLDGITTNGANNHQSSGCGGAFSNDVVYELMPMFTGQVTVSISGTQSDYQAVLAARASCDLIATQIDCDVDNNNPGGESFTLDVMSASPIYIWVDGWNGADGHYVMQMNPM